MLADANLNVILTNMSTAHKQRYLTEKNKVARDANGPSVHYLYNVASHPSLDITRPSSCRTQKKMAQATKH